MEWTSKRGGIIYQVANAVSVNTELVFLFQVVMLDKFAGAFEYVHPGFVVRPPLVTQRPFFIRVVVLHAQQLPLLVVQVGKLAFGVALQNRIRNAI